MRVERLNVVLGSISREAITDAENHWAAQGWKPIPPWVDESGLLKLEREVPDDAPIAHSGRPQPVYAQIRTTPGPGRYGPFWAALAIPAVVGLLAAVVR